MENFKILLLQSDIHVYYSGQQKLEEISHPLPPPSPKYTQILVMS